MDKYKIYYDKLWVCTGGNVHDIYSDHDKLYKGKYFSLPNSNGSTINSDVVNQYKEWRNI